MRRIFIGGFISVLAVSAPHCRAQSLNETLNFSNNQIPAGWSITFPNGGIDTNGSITNNRFEADQVDTYALLSQNLQLPAGTTSLSIDYTADIADNYWGMGTSAAVYDTTGNVGFAYLDKAGFGYEAVNAGAVYQSGIGSEPNLSVQSTSPSYGTYNVMTTFQNGQVSISATMVGSSTPTYQATTPMPQLNLSNVSKIGLYAYTTSGAPAWINNVTINSLATTPTTQTPDPALTNHFEPTANNLDVYNPSTGTFQNAQQGGVLYPNRPTVVLTLGWNEKVTDWPLQIAKAFPGAGTGVNVVAWDWSQDADTGLFGSSTGGSLSLADSSTSNDGYALGQTLATLLGSNYNHSIQFIGHSLGTLVNSRAISYLFPRVLSAPIQDTLLDEASIANHAPGAAPTFEVSAIPEDAQGNPLPLMRIDNYISSFGEPYAQAANFILQDNPTDPPSTDSVLYWGRFHDYPQTFYDQTLPGGTGSGSSVGYAGSIENGPFNPNNPVYQPGTYALQSTNTGGEFSFSSILQATAAQFLLNRNNEELNALQSDAAQLPQSAADYIAELISGLTVAQLTGAVQYENSVLVTLIPDQGPQFALTKATSTTAAANAKNNATESSDSPTSSSYAWVPISIPANAQYISLDFVFHDLSPDDFLTVGINDTPLFQLEDQFVTDGLTENSGLLDVSQWDGQDVQLFLGLNASDDNNIGGTITINDIEFAEVPEPGFPCQIIGMIVCILGQFRAGRRCFNVAA